MRTGQAGAYAVVDLSPTRPGALGIGWLASPSEVVLDTGGTGPGGRWELEPIAQDLDHLEDLVRAVIAGRVVEAGTARRSRLEVTLGDGTVVSSTGYAGVAGCLVLPGWTSRARTTRYAPWT